MVLFRAVRHGYGDTAVKGSDARFLEVPLVDFHGSHEHWNEPQTDFSIKHTTEVDMGGK